MPIHFKIIKIKFNPCYKFGTDNLADVVIDCICVEIIHGFDLIWIGLPNHREEREICSEM